MQGLKKIIHSLKKTYTVDKATILALFVAVSSAQ